MLTIKLRIRETLTKILTQRRNAKYCRYSGHCATKKFNVIFFQCSRYISDRTLYADFTVKLELTQQSEKK